MRTRSDVTPHQGLLSVTDITVPPQGVAFSPGYQSLTGAWQQSRYGPMDFFDEPLPLTLTTKLRDRFLTMLTAHIIELLSTINDLFSRAFDASSSQLPLDSATHVCAVNVSVFVGRIFLHAFVCLFRFLLLWLHTRSWVQRADSLLAAPRGFFAPHLHCSHSCNDSQDDAAGVRPTRWLPCQLVS